MFDFHNLFSFALSIAPVVIKLVVDYRVRVRFRCNRTDEIVLRLYALGRR